MTIGLSVSGTPTATTASIAMATMGASGTIEMQVAFEPDFKFCVAPIYTGIARTSPFSLTGLNQRCRYYVRARTRLTSGVAEDWSPTLGFRTADGTAQTTTPASVMIQPAIIVLPEPILATLGDSAVTGFPSFNVTRDAPVCWQSTHASLHGITITTAGNPIDTIAVLNTNLPEATTVTIRGDNSSANLGASAAFILSGQNFRASANMPGRPGYHGLFRLSSPQSYRYWRLEFSVSTLPTTKAYFEHIILGLNRSSKNYSADMSESPLPLGTLERGRTGYPDRVQGLAMRRADFTLSYMTEAQFQTLYQDLIYRANEPVFVVPNSLAGVFLHDRMLYGDLSGGRVVHPSSPRFNRQFTVDSLI